MVGRPTGERGSSVMQQSLVSFSKYSLSNLALRSIVELERMNAGLDSNPDVFTNLATALRQNSEPSACTLQFRFVEPGRSEEHTSELQSLMRISYAVFCLKKKTKKE